MTDSPSSNVHIYTVPIFPPPHGMRDDFPPGQYVLYSDYLALKRAAPEPTTGHWYCAEDIDHLVRELDVWLNGEAGAAKQAKLCDVVAQITRRSPPPSAATAFVIEAIEECIRWHEGDKWRNSTVPHERQAWEKHQRLLNEAHDTLLSGRAPETKSACQCGGTGIFNGRPCELCKPLRKVPPVETSAFTPHSQCKSYDACRREQLCLDGWHCASSISSEQR